MRKNHSYSLQKINPNAAQLRRNNTYSDRSLPINARLNFPLIGDSHFYGGVGKKHYEESSKVATKLLLDPQYMSNDIFLPRSKSQNKFKAIQNPILQESLRPSKQQICSKRDSLTLLQQQISKKINTSVNATNSPSKYQKYIYTQESPSKKIENNSPVKHSSYLMKNHLNLPQLTINYNYTNKLKIDSITHNKKQDFPIRKMHPTFLSSQLGYI